MLRGRNVVNDLNAEIGARNARINELISEIEALKKRPVVTEVKTMTNTVTVPTETLVDRTTVVMFAQNSAVLTADAKAALDNVTASKVLVEATASPEGTAEYNLALSEERAKVVADYLTKRGITVTSAIGKGAVDSASNRVAIVIAQ